MTVGGGAQLPVFPARPHEHIRFAREIVDGPRLRRATGAGRAPRHPDHGGHGRELERDLLKLSALHARRVPVLGVKPELVLVLHHNTPPDVASLRDSGLYVLDWLRGRVVVTAGSEPDLSAFTSKLDAYKTGPRPPRPGEVLVEPASATSGTAGGEPPPAPSDGEDPAHEEAGRPKVRAAPNEPLFDAIDAVTGFGPEDVVTEELSGRLAAAGEGDPLRVDVQCWCPEEADEARRLAASVADAVAGEGAGHVLDQTLRHRAGLSLLRIEAPAATVRALASMSEVRRLDLLPRPMLSRRESVGIEIGDLPLVVAPEPDAPIVAVIDSGVRSGHPMIGPAVLDAIAVPPLADPSDAHGHGTHVSSLALYGSLEPLLAELAPMRPAGRLVSIRVLDDNAQFPDARLWENDLMGALELAGEAGARVINLSLGDDRRPYRPDRPTPLAAALDDFVRRTDVVLVVSAGNYPLSSFPASDSLGSDYQLHQAQDEAAGLLDPASSALSLTVGALCSDDHQGHRPAVDRVDTVPAGGQGLPSPVTRIGPGSRNMIKPDLAAPGGGPDHRHDTGQLVRFGGVLGADGTRPDRLIALDSGTSFAAPLVTHCALRALASGAVTTGAGARALVLGSVDARRAVDFAPDGLTDAGNRVWRQRFAGYGRPDPVRAEASTDHRAVLVAEDVIALDGVHLYRVPVPGSFFQPGGWRTLSVALAFTPVTRSTRLEYLASVVQVNVFHGADLDTVYDSYVAAEPVDIAEGPPGTGGEAPSGLDSTAAENEAEEGARGAPPSLRKHLQELQPSVTARAAGANQFAAITYRQRLRRDRGPEFVVAVRNVNRWSPPGAPEPYALVVVLEREEGHAPIYAELRAAIELRATAEVEVEV